MELRASVPASAATSRTAEGVSDREHRERPRTAEERQDDRAVRDLNVLHVMEQRHGGLSVDGSVARRRGDRRLTGQVDRRAGGDAVLDRQSRFDRPTRTGNQASGPEDPSLSRHMLDQARHRSLPAQHSTTLRGRTSVCLISSAVEAPCASVPAGAAPELPVCAPPEMTGKRLRHGCRQMLASAALAVPAARASQGLS